MQREDSAKKVRRGMAGVVRAGRHAGGRPYGYRVVPGHCGELKVIEEEAEVVRRIFAAYAAGRPPREIAGDLNRDRVAPPRGARWNASTINGNSKRGAGIIFNELYLGRIVWNKVRMVKNPDTGKRLSRPNPREEWQTVPAPHLRIIDDDTWARVHERKIRKSASYDPHEAPPRAFAFWLAAMWMLRVWHVSPRSRQNRQDPHPMLCRARERQLH